VLRKASVLPIAFLDGGSGRVGGDCGGTRLAHRNLTAHPGTPRFDSIPRSVVFRVLLLEVRDYVLGAVSVTCSLRVINRRLQGFARACESPISKGFPLLWLAVCCRALRSKWCQSGVRSRPWSPVVREHRVGSSPTSGTRKIPANVAKNAARKGKPRRERRGRLLQPYCNPSTEGFFEGACRAVLHVGEHVGVGVQGDGYA
jgi:hypothetical protein